MARTKVVRGFFGAANGKSIEGAVKLTFLSKGLSETLSVEYTGVCRLDMPYRPIEQLVKGGRVSLGKDGAGREISAVITGQYTDRRVTLNRGEITTWYRGGSPVEVLSFAFEDTGQITIPLSPLLSIVSAERSMRA